MKQKQQVEKNNHKPTQPQPGLRFLDAAGCAERYGFSSIHWRRLVDAGRAPSPTRFGRLLRWSLAELEVWEGAGCPESRRLAK